MKEKIKNHLQRILDIRDLLEYSNSISEEYLSEAIAVLDMLTRTENLLKELNKPNQSAEECLKSYLDNDSEVEAQVTGSGCLLSEADVLILMEQYASQQSECSNTEEDRFITFLNWYRKHQEIHSWSVDVVLKEFYRELPKPPKQ